MTITLFENRVIGQSFFVRTSMASDSVVPWQNGVSITVRLMILVGIMLACIVGIVSLTLWMGSVQSSDAIHLDLAGRQRMLAERFANSFLDSVEARRSRATACDTAAGTQAFALSEQDTTIPSRSMLEKFAVPFSFLWRKEIRTYWSLMTTLSPCSLLRLRSATRHSDSKRQATAKRPFPVSPKPSPL